MPDPADKYRITLLQMIAGRKVFNIQITTSAIKMPGFFVLVYVDKKKLPDQLIVGLCTHQFVQFFRILNLHFDDPAIAVGV